MCGMVIKFVSFYDFFDWALKLFQQWYFLFFILSFIFLLFWQGDLSQLNKLFQICYLTLW